MGARELLAGGGPQRALCLGQRHGGIGAAAQPAKHLHHQVARGGTLHRPMADDQAARAGMHEGTREPGEALAAAGPARRVAGRQNDQFGAEAHLLDDLPHGQPAVLAAQISRH